MTYSIFIFVSFSLKGSQNVTACIKCTKGYYCSGGKKEQCTDNTFTSDDGSFCQKCMPGYECNKDSEPKKCPPGKYGENAACKECATGTYQDNEGSTFCKTCSPGTVLTKAKTGCEKCSKGTYNDGMNSTISACQPCPDNTYQDMEGQAICKTCVQGKYPEKQIGSTSCDNCPAGYLCTGGRKGACPPGHYCMGGNALVCPMGTYSAGLDKVEECKKCEKGTYNKNTTSTSSSDCKACGPNQSTLNYGTTSETKCGCIAGYYMQDKVDINSKLIKECVTCDNKKYVCTGFNITSKDLKAAKDSFVISDSITGDVVAYKCPAGTCKEGGGCSSDAGYKGFLCSSCLPGYFKRGSIQSDTACSKCNLIGLVITESMLSLLFGLLSFGYMVYKKMETLKKIVNRTNHATSEKSSSLADTDNAHGSHEANGSEKVDKAVDEKVEDKPRVALHSLALRLTLSHLQVVRY